MKKYRIRNRITNTWWEGKANSIQEALVKAGWAKMDCEIKEYSENGGGGWKKAKEAA